VNPLRLNEQIRAELDGIAPWRQRLDRTLRNRAERLHDWATAHWLLLANSLAAYILLGAVAAPLLSLAGLSASSQAIYAAYRWLCPQRPTHSYFLFGPLPRPIGR